MTDITPRTGAPLLAAAQAQKHVTHNEARYQLDALLCARFIDRDLSAPPSSPADGDTYLVKSTGTGAWAGQDGKIAYCADGNWRFYAPFAGLVAYVSDEAAIIVYDAGSWVDYSATLAPAFLVPDQTRAAIRAAPIEAMSDLLLNINGGMEVSQENAANSVALAATGTLQTKYLVDGVMAAFRGSFVASAQQVTDCPPGFRNSLKLAVTTAQSSLGANDELSLVVPVEGLNAARLAFGTAQANACAIFFWVKSHRTGAFSGSLRNAGKTRSYPFGFTITAADTWEMKSVLVGAGDTAGTWAIDTSVGLYATICIAGGTSRLGAPNAWAASDCSGATGTVNAVAATSDVFQITGFGVLPLVAGASFADVPDAAHSPFIVRPRPKEVLLAKRFYQDVCRANGGLAAASFLMQKSSASTIDGPFQFPVEMRIAPTLRHSNPSWAGGSPSGNQINFYDNSGSGFLTISGALTVTTAGADTSDAIILRLQAGTSFTGTVGDMGNLYLGGSAYLALDARL